MKCRAIAVQRHRAALTALNQYNLFVSAFSAFSTAQEKTLREEVAAMGRDVTLAGGSQDSGAASLLQKRRLGSPFGDAKQQALFPFIFHSRFLWRGFSQDETKMTLYSDAVKAFKQAETTTRSADITYGLVQLYMIGGSMTAAVASAATTANLLPMDSDAAALHAALLVASGKDASPSAAQTLGALPNLNDLFSQAEQQHRAHERDVENTTILNALLRLINSDPCTQTAHHATLRLSTHLKAPAMLSMLMGDPKLLVRTVDSLCLAIETLERSTSSRAPLPSSSLALQATWTALDKILHHLYNKLESVVADFENDHTLLGLEMVSHAQHVVSKIFLQNITLKSFSQT